MTTQSLSRRNFLKAAGAALAASAVACTGLGYLAALSPQIDTPELTFGKDNPMNQRILITYATRAGSTVEVASAIAENLGTRGYEVDLKPVKEKPDLSGYQAAILGSAIRMGSWLPEMVDYIKSNQQALNRLPVALFTVHMLNTGEDETSRTARLAYLSPVRPLLDKPEEAFFAGKMDFSSLSFLDRTIARMVKAVEADNRDWDQIRAWTPSVLNGSRAA